MRTLIMTVLLALPVSAFSAPAQPPVHALGEIKGVCAHRGQLGPEDIAQIESVQPTDREPLQPLVLTGIATHRGQLSDEDISQIESVRPAHAIIYGWQQK